MGAGSLWPESVPTSWEQRRLKTVTLNNLCDSCRASCPSPDARFQQQNKLCGHVFAGRKGNMWRWEFDSRNDTWESNNGCYRLPRRCGFDCRVPWPCPNAIVQKTTTLAQALSLPGQLTRQGGTNCHHVCNHFICPASASSSWASFSMLTTVIAFQRSLRHAYGKTRSRTSRLLFFVFFFFFSPNTGHTVNQYHQRTLKDAWFCWVPVPYLTMSPKFCPCH
jgi:hypothetical protein